MFPSGLILEGGGMRGVYTAGVLEYFMEKDQYFPYVIGVSAGACNAASYLSRQRGRNRSVTIDYVGHPDYISIWNFFRKRELFGMDLIFDKIPNELVPFDFERFRAAKERFFIGTTDCLTGDSVYFEKSECVDDILPIIRASSSLPYMSQAMYHGDRYLMDGGISDPIPIRKALADVVDKAIIILTKEKGYRKKPSQFTKTTRYLYRDFPGLTQALERRWQLYNETLEEIEQLEEEHKIFVIRPSQSFKVRRAERNVARLEQLHELGYSDAENTYVQLRKWIMN
ncbi:patatin family protein [Planococcus sp. ISL-109]|uniref:patatin-like phospholipase family protein n=1 Tax=Planococcus sp. ISL-109 TaxID=2819166 RepID=UPI001BE8FA8A|nr:patatin family protein [Planococcus sp. ISL-109]MBT2581352.1 patatin family protein [Planococcus sp. ISL-109]